MVRRAARGRSGITLVEILISILIMGVGIISLATLFPLGLLRLREAARYSRSAILTESASSDAEARNLFGKQSFLNFSPWYRINSSTGVANVNGVNYDPWVQDTPLSASPNATTGGAPNGAFRGYGMDGSQALGFAYNGGAAVFPYIGPGLPVAYDPLYWSIVGDLNGSNPGLRPNNGTHDIRFGALPWTSTTKTALGATPVYGLQRVTNFLPTVRMDQSARDTFISPEDIVWQVEPNAGTTGIGGNATVLSPIVPDLTLSGGQVTNDYRYTWMFTGQQIDSGTTFEGDIVIFENRQFGFNANNIADGETTVEAVFGYSKKVIQGSAGTYGYAPQPNYTVLLRWLSSASVPNGILDPEVKVGSWLADVTYERYAGNDVTEKVAAIKADPGNSNTVVPVFPSQRCYWYQVVKKSAPTSDVLGSANYRSMVVWVSTPLRALTLLDSTGNPAYTNAAMISPHVVNVFPRTIYTR